MIRTSTQLKAKVRNVSGGDNLRAAVLIRNFIMERFLERVSISPYRHNFILKGGMLVAAIVGLETRATMDVDTTVRSIPLSRDGIQKTISEILSIPVDDGINFTITKVSDIMEDHDYPGIRLMIEASLDRLRQTIKIDVSTGDIITPSAVEFLYQLMFENRTIPLWTYNIETLLAEKLETILARQTANTRMRDFYDIYVILQDKQYDKQLLKEAFLRTSKARGSDVLIPKFSDILQNVQRDATMAELWEKYVESNYFVSQLRWEEVVIQAKELKEQIGL